MFKCKACPEKSERIADLKAEIAFLRAQLVPQGNPLVHYEADAVLSGQQHVIELHSDQLPTDESEEELSERDRILSGNF